MRSSALDRLLAGSSFHSVERDRLTVRLTPRALSDAGLANFQNIVALAQQGEWHGYRIERLQRRSDLGGLPESIVLELIDS